VRQGCFLVPLVERYGQCFDRLEQFAKRDIANLVDDIV